MEEVTVEKKVTASRAIETDIFVSVFDVKLEKR